VSGEAVTSWKTHPHIDRPSQAQLRRLLEGKSPAIRDLYLGMHRLVLETLPDVASSVDCSDGQIGYGARQHGYDGWGMAAVAPHTKWISPGFLRGTSLEDPDKLLEGTGASVRHIKVRSQDELVARRAALQRLLKGAADLQHR
jgi:hypothetical protein